jgi:hypothetical protein
MNWNTPLQNACVGLATMALTLLTGCARLPDDGAKTQMQHFDNLHALRYIEIFIVGGNPITGNLKANVYNSTRGLHSQGLRASGVGRIPEL